MTLVLPQSSLEWVVGVLLRATVLMTVGVLLWIGLRNATAAKRHSVLTSAVVGLLFLPLAPLLLPTWLVEAEPGTLIAGRLGFNEHPAERLIQEPVQHLIGSGVVDLVTNLGAPGFSQLPDISHLLAVIYLAGVVIMLLRALIGEVAHRRAAHPSIVESGEWLHHLRQAMTLGGLDSRVTLLRSERSMGPVTWGILNPAIVLPASADGWTQHRWQSVLLHEIAHIRRRDGLVQLLSVLAVAIYWCHPGAWWISRKLRYESELACDHRVFSAGVSPISYAEDLLQIARSLRGGATPYALSMASMSTLEKRLRALLHLRQQDTSRGRVGFAFALILIACVTGLLAMLKLQERSFDAAVGSEDTTIVEEASDRGDEAYPVLVVPREPQDGSEREGVEASESEEAVGPDRPPAIRLVLRNAEAFHSLLSSIYPSERGTSKAGGDVVLSVHVATGGRVIGTRLEKSSGIAALDTAASMLMKSAEFEPFGSHTDASVWFLELLVQFRPNDSETGGPVIISPI